MALKLKKFDSINVVPFIDIMLVLLAMVLTMATFVAQGVIPVELPKAGSSVQRPATTREIVIQAGGQLYLDSRPVDVAALDAALGAGNPSDTILVRSDKKTPFEHFVTVMDLLKQHRYEKLSIITEAKNR